jgi:hypothetical protein
MLFERPVRHWSYDLTTCFDPVRRRDFFEKLFATLRSIHLKGSPIMNVTPQVETREISDADLDNVSGGLIGGLVGTVTGTVDSIAPVSTTLGGVVGTVEGLTGVNTSVATGLIAGL